jgi:hypothetical protein
MAGSAGGGMASLESTIAGYCAAQILVTPSRTYAQPKSIEYMAEAPRTLGMARLVV